MQRDIRDPISIGTAMEQQRQVHPDLHITKIADNVLDGSLIRNHGESHVAYRKRCDEVLGRNGKLTNVRN